MPSRTLPQRPFRWSALLRETGRIGRLVVRDRALYTEILANPESMTKRMPGIVRDVSAMFVATTIFRPGAS